MKEHLIEKEDVARVAKLARIRFTEQETATLTKQLGSILTYVGELEGVDTRGIEPTFQVAPEHNRWRDDVVRQHPEAMSDALLAAAPMREGRYVKVPAVFQ